MRRFITINEPWIVAWLGYGLGLHAPGQASAPEAVWIDGVQQPIETRQTKLRDRYRDLQRRDLPEAYRR